MSIRLRLVSVWMPRFMMAREIERIRSRTDEALDTLLAEHALEAPSIGKEELGRTLEERRAAMARGHEKKVRTLIEGVGRERAINLGREALFSTGLALGREAKGRLGVRDTREDLLRAAGVLYRILGIEFIVVAGPEGDRMEVTRCALSPHYSPEACLILSAVDEGTVSGLGPRAGLLFEKRITDGSPRCVASIRFQEER
jgi:hypothetical protein